MKTKKLFALMAALNWIPAGRATAHLLGMRCDSSIERWPLCHKCGGPTLRKVLGTPTTPILTDTEHRIP